MKKTMISALAAFAAGAAMAAANDLLVTFSTPGPDTYADGSVVMDGERYALCWSSDFSNFKIKADGTAEGGEVVLKAPVAKGGRCPTVVFEVDAAYAAENYSGGEWAVYLLDTRKFGADDTASVPQTGATVNTAGLVGKASVGQGTIGSITGVAASANEIAVGADVPKPAITGIRVVDGYVYVTVKDTVPFLAYGLATGDAPNDVAEQTGDAKTGSLADEITIVTQAKEGGAFFKVGAR